MFRAGQMSFKQSLELAFFSLVCGSLQDCSVHCCSHKGTQQVKSTGLGTLFWGTGIEGLCTLWGWCPYPSIPISIASPTASPQNWTSSMQNWECWEANITSLQGTHAYFQNKSGKTLLFLVKKNMGRSYNHSPTAYMVFVSFGECLCSSNSNARYSGHTLSRLAEIRHNKTKQSRFPTTWRESPESWETWSNNSKSSWLSRVLNFYWVQVPSVSRDLYKVFENGRDMKCGWPSGLTQ